MSPPDASFLLPALSGGVLLEAAAVALAFVALLFLGSLILPGRRIAGPDAEGNERIYKLNGLALFLITALAAGLAQFFGWFSLSALYAHFAALFVAANAFAFALAGWLYLQGARALGAAPGFWRGYFRGVDAGPVWFGLDLKLFSYRPSLIGLALFNASFAVVQWETYGELTLAMALYQAFTFLYVLNYFQFEHGMLHTWDIISERFGWMLVWGDYVLVPFFYCLPGLVAGSRAGPAVSGRRHGHCRVVRLWLLALPRRQSAEARLQARPRDLDLGTACPDPGRVPPGFRFLGHRAAPQLYGRDLRLSRVRAHHRVRIVGALPAAGMAGGPVVASFETR